MSKLQNDLDKATAGQIFKLEPGKAEFDGPVVIRKPIVLDGQDGTIWANKGPVLTVASSGVVIERLNVEVTGSAVLGEEQSLALVVEQTGRNISLKNVAVRGEIRGLPGEEGTWRYPLKIPLGHNLEPKRKHQFVLKLFVPSPCVLRSKIDGLRVSPERLGGGVMEEVTLSIDEQAPGTLIRGEIWIETKHVTRKIQVSATVKAGASGTVAGDGQIIWEASVGTAATAGTPKPVTPTRTPAVPRPPKPVQTGVPVVPSLIEDPNLPPTDPVVPMTVRVSASVPLRTKEIVVSQLGDGDYTTIRAALAAVQSGARVIVRPGLYRESLVLNQRVEIVGDGRPEEVVLESTDGNCLCVTGGYTKLNQLTLRAAIRPGATARYAIRVQEGHLIMESCFLSSNSLACLAVHGGAAFAMVRRCRIEEGASAGVLFYDGAEGQFEDCDIRGHRRAGVEVRGSANPAFENCRIVEGHDVGILVHDGGQGKFKGCEIAGNALAGVEVLGASTPTLTRCRIHDGRDVGALIHDDGQPIFEGVEVFANARAGIVFGSKAAGRLINCDIHDNAFAGVEIRYDAAAVLEKRCKIHHGKQHGLVVFGKGRSKVSDCEIFDNPGCGVLVAGDARPEFARCKVRGNGLAGMAVWRQGRPELKECEISDNAVVGVATHEGGHVSLIGGEVRGNGDAGVWAGPQGGGRIEDCDLTGNKGGPVEVEAGGKLESLRNKTA